MGAMSRESILQFYEKMNDNQSREDIIRFRDFLIRLFDKRALDGCSFFTSHYTFCIVRHATYEEWRFKPLLSLEFPTPGHVLIELTITQGTSPACRTITYASTVPYDLAFEEFDRLYGKFLSAHEELKSNAWID